MPLTLNLVKEVVFDPEAIEPMVTAYKAACQSLQLVDPDTLLTQIVARNVVEMPRLASVILSGFAIRCCSL